MVGGTSRSPLLAQLLDGDTPRIGDTLNLHVRCWEGIVHSFDVRPDSGVRSVPIRRQRGIDGLVGESEDVHYIASYVGTLEALGHSAHPDLGALKRLAHVVYGTATVTSQAWE